MSTTKTAPSAKKESATVRKDSVAKVKSIFNPTANQRIKKLENFERLAERYRKLESKKDELESFNVSVDGINEKMVLHSGSASFEISNSRVINQLKDGIEKMLSELLEQSEKEIVEFQI